MYKESKAYFLLFAIGLIIFFTITFTFSFKDKVFQAFFQRPFSLAADSDNTPKVDLTAAVDGSYKRGVVNVEKGKSNILLNWKTENNPESCTGRFWSNVKKNDSWVGAKDVKGGSYVITDSLNPGIYVYSLDCANEFGDSSGSSLTINAGGKQTYLKPHITDIQVSLDNTQINPGKPIVVNRGTEVTITWSAVNMETPFGVCLATGSWPTIYKNAGNLQIKESFKLDKLKIYKYSIFCSNENGVDKQETSFVVK